jgi:hypothetical protein
MILTALATFLGIEFISSLSVIERAAMADPTVKRVGMRWDSILTAV